MPTASLLEIFATLQKVELTASDYYAACALHWENDREFWASLVKEEMTHEQYLKQAAEIVRQSPADFLAGRPFTPEAAQTVIRGIKEHIEKIAHGDMTADKALYYARIVEQSLIELKYLEIVQSKNAAFLNLMREVVGQTDTHLARINKKIAALPPHA